MLSKNNLMLSPTARRLDSRLADEECVLALEKTTPRNPPQQNLYFVCVPHTVCHCTLEKLRCGIERNRFLIVSSVELSRLPISTMILINHD